MEARHQNTLLYGFVDGVGEEKAFDLKSTKSYSPERFANNHQNLYLLGLQTYGIKQLDYIITDFQEVYVESYHIDNYDFEPLFKEIKLFTEFLEENRKFIRDKKIFDSKSVDNQLSLFD